MVNNNCLIISQIVLTFIVGPVGWSRRMHQMHLCRGVRLPPPWVSSIWHKSIWWWGSSNAGALGNAEYLFIAFTLRCLLWFGVVPPDKVLSTGQIELNWVLMLNWILEIELSWNLYCVLMLKWTVWNRIVSMNKMDLALNNLQWLICH